MLDLRRIVKQSTAQAFQLAVINSDLLGLFQFLAQQAQGEDALGRMILHLTLVSTCRPCAQANLWNLSPPFTE